MLFLLLEYPYHEAMGCGALEQARQVRLRSGIQRHASNFATSLESVRQRMGEGHQYRKTLTFRSSYDEGMSPRLAAFMLGLRETAIFTASRQYQSSCVSSRKGPVRMTSCIHGVRCLVFFVKCVLYARVLPTRYCAHS